MKGRASKTGDAPPAPGLRDICARCGAPFECGMKAGVERCWCADLPRVPIDAALSGCLCPRCLAEHARTQHVAAP